ncbi:hypothetical protein GCM10018965_023890 [Nonomuraea roseola]
MGLCLGITLAAAVRYAPGRQAAMAAVVVQPALAAQAAERDHVLPVGGELGGGRGALEAERVRLATILLPDQIRLWPPTCGFGRLNALPLADDPPGGDREDDWHGSGTRPVSPVRSA